MENREARPHTQNRNRGKGFNYPDFIQRPEYSCLALKILITMRQYCAEKNFSAMHQAIFDNYVLATMAGVKQLPKDLLQQTSGTLSKYGYKMVRLDATRYAVLRMPHIDQNWTKLGSKRTSKMPNDFRQLSETLDAALAQKKVEE